MYAYIKLLSAGKCTTVGINQIKNYSKKKPNKIFDVKIKGVYQRCLIGAVRDSKEELTELIENGERIRFPSAAILSELSETDDQASSKTTTSPLKDNTRDILNSKLLALDKITGAGSGVGRELAIQFAEFGATVVCWDKDTRRNNAVIEEIRKKDGDVYFNAIEMVKKLALGTQVAAIAMHMRRQLTDVSMVISNAGALTCAPICQLRPATVAKLIEVNLLAHVWIIQAFLPNMIDRRQGHIVAINSSLGLVPCADMVPYCAAKFGLRGLMDSLSEELRLDSWTKNIITTSVYLSTVSTGLYPTPSHRFVSCYSEISAKDAAKIIIEGIRNNKKCICIPSYMKLLLNLHNLLPYRLRVIFMDFFNFGCRGWFCFC